MLINNSYGTLRINPVAYQGDFLIDTFASPATQNYSKSLTAQPKKNGIYIVSINLALADTLSYWGRLYVNIDGVRIANNTFENNSILNQKPVFAYTRFIIKATKGQIITAGLEWGSMPTSNITVQPLQIVINEGW